MVGLPSPSTETNPFRRKHTSIAGTTTPPTIVPANFSFNAAFETLPTSSTESEDPWAVRTSHKSDKWDAFSVVEASEKLTGLELEETKDEERPDPNLRIPNPPSSSKTISTPEATDATSFPPPVLTPPVSSVADVPERPTIPTRPSSHRGPVPPTPPPPPPHAKRVSVTQGQTGGLTYSRSRRGPRPPPPPRPASRKGNSGCDVASPSSASTSVDALSLPAQLPETAPGVQTASNESNIGVTGAIDPSPQTTFPAGSLPIEARPALERTPPSSNSLSSPIELRPPPLERTLPSSDSITSHKSIDQNPFRKYEPHVEATTPAPHIGRAQTSPVEPVSSFSFDDALPRLAVPERANTVPSTAGETDPAALRSAALDASLASLTGAGNDEPDPPTRPCLPASRPSRRSTHGISTPTSRPASSAGPPPPPPPARRISVRPSAATSSNRISRYGMPPPPPPPVGSRQNAYSPGAQNSVSSPPSKTAPEIPKSDTDSAVGLTADPSPAPSLSEATPVKEPKKEKDIAVFQQPAQVLQQEKEPKVPSGIADLEIEGGERTAELDDDLEREILGLEA